MLIKCSSLASALHSPPRRALTLLGLLHSCGIFGPPDWDRVKILSENGLRAGYFDCLTVLGKRCAELGDVLGARQHFEDGIRKGVSEARTSYAFNLQKLGFDEKAREI